MASSRHRIAAWATLGALVVLGAIGAHLQNSRDPRGEVLPVRNVNVQVDPAFVTTGVTSTVTFISVDGGGEKLDAWDGRLDGWIIRDDLAFVQHVTGEQEGPTSTVQLAVTPSEPGSYRMAIISTSESNVTAGGTALRVRGTSRDLPPGEQSAAREGYKVTLSTIPGADEIRAGEPVTFTYGVERTDTQVPLEEYGGSRGALIAFREGGGLFVLGDAMPAELLPSHSASTFSVTFPEEGSYRVFFEFQAAGRRFIEARWVEVAPGS
jgi:plastocyanin